jgi:hypothetical protein
LNPLYSIGRQLTETILTHLPVSAEEARRRAVRLLDETGSMALRSRPMVCPERRPSPEVRRCCVELAGASPAAVSAEAPRSRLQPRSTRDRAGQAERQEPSSRRMPRTRGAKSQAQSERVNLAAS